MSVWPSTLSLEQVSFRSPCISDGMQIFELAVESIDLDVNAAYSYLLWCRDFAQTSIVGIHDGSIISFVIGYMRPACPNTLFIWQVAVRSIFRRRGFGMRSLDALIERVAHEIPKLYIEASVTPDNLASNCLFDAFARVHDSSVIKEPFFSQDDFKGQHKPEILLRLGPIEAHSLMEPSLRNEEG